MRYLADMETNRAPTYLQAASCTYRIALGNRRARKWCACEASPRRQAIHTGPLRHLHSCSLLAPHAKLRIAIVPSPRQDASAHPPITLMRLLMGAHELSALCSRAFDIDIEHCPDGGAHLKMLATVEDAGHSELRVPAGPTHVSMN